MAIALAQRQCLGVNFGGSDGQAPQVSCLKLAAETLFMMVRYRGSGQPFPDQTRPPSSMSGSLAIRGRVTSVCTTAEIRRNRPLATTSQGCTASPDQTKETAMKPASQTKSSTTHSTKGHGERAARQKYEHYLALARVEASHGNRIAAENFYQHADHYFRTAESSRTAPAEA